jgi:hypothetical protein
MLPDHLRVYHTFALRILPVHVRVVHLVLRQVLLVLLLVLRHNRAILASLRSAPSIDRLFTNWSVAAIRSLFFHEFTLLRMLSWLDLLI